jgi:integrase/recombinase XerD
MSMQAHAEDYLAMRRSLGFKLRGEGRMLAGFAARLDEEGQATITISAALAWATESPDAAPAHRRRRLSVVRGFAQYLATVDPACQIPPADLLPAPSHRPPPYIYSAGEIAALIHAAETIGAPLPAATMCCPSLNIPMKAALVIPMWGRGKAPRPWWLRGLGGGGAGGCG